MIYLENVLTTIEGYPYRFWVNVVPPANDTSNPLDRNPYVYSFEDTIKHNSVNDKSFNVKVTPQVAGNSIDNISKELHCDVIRFGLISKSQMPESDEFVLDTSTYEIFRNAIRQEGQELKHEILRFVHLINSHWPEQGVSVYDLADNFANSYDELREWTLNLYKADLLSQKRESHVYRKNRGQVRANPFIENPSKSEEIRQLLSRREEELSPGCFTSVFVVHGHNLELLGKVSTFLAELGLEPIILHEQPDKGRTIIEKFTEHADVPYAVVLLTGDDIGGKAGTRLDGLKPRPRQNVVFELGYFLGKIGRNRVCALYEGGVEILSDYSGVLYISIDSEGAWRSKLARELKAAGLPIDMKDVAG